MHIEIIKRIILENPQVIKNKKFIIRNYNIPQSDSIIVLTGIRRCGKTYTLYEIAQKYNVEEILFLDFEDERLIGLNALSSYDLIIDAYKMLFPGKKPVLFFDEIQNLKNWHLFLKRLHVAGYRIFVTGSNANLISRDIATYLKGRSIEINIFPFSFREFLKLKNVIITREDQYIDQPKVLNLFDEYLMYGGFPEVIKAETEDKRLIAKNIYNLLFYKDLVTRFDKDVYLLKLIVSKITENITKEFSISGLSKKIISIYKTSVPTINSYFSVLPEPFLTTNIYPYRRSFLIRQAKRKTYLADNSFIFLNTIEQDRSRLLENAVFNHLLRKYEVLYYYKTNNNKEVDFYITSDDVKIMIQVSYLINDEETKKRELSSLKKAMNEQDLKNAFIFTYNTAGEEMWNDKKIEIVPFWKVLLNDEITN